MIADVLIHQSHDGTWSAQCHSMYLAAYDTPRQYGLQATPFYWDTLYSLLGAIEQAYEQKLLEYMPMPKDLYASSPMYPSTIGRIGYPDLKLNLLSLCGDAALYSPGGEAAYGKVMVRYINGVLTSGGAESEIIQWISLYN